MEIDQLFEEALLKATKITYPLPVDVRLRLYAYYKQATRQPIGSKSSGEHELVNAFKMNAWMQVRLLTTDQAKKEYIALIEELYKNI